MAKTLTQAIQNQITYKDIKTQYDLTINSTSYDTYLLGFNISSDKKFGSASATFILNNSDGRFGSDGDDEIKVGYIVEFSEYFSGDTTEWERFYGKVESKSVSKTESSRIITITCLDYISILQHWDINLEVEGNKVEVTNETLIPNYLTAPNDMFAQLFDFKNNSVADNPRPILMIRNQSTSTDEPQYDGFDVYYDVGQVKFGAPLNAKDNYNVIARTYYYYTKGQYCEDILEEILTQVDGYGNYLFGETSAADVITNHLTTTFNGEEGTNTDNMTPNTDSTTFTIETTLAADISAGATSILLTDSTGFPTGDTYTATINGDIFTYTTVESGNTLSGIPATGSNALKSHSSGDYVEYEATYSAGQLWYLTYSNISTDLTTNDFTYSGANFRYFDKRNGRLVLDTAISVGATVTCNTNYTFKTLQATGIELNRIAFRSRELDNAFEAIQKLRQYLAPNYIIRTQGDTKIWSSYLSQNTTEDYTLNLIQNINYMEDEDLFTRVIFYGKNKNPTNLLFDENVDFVTTGESYKSFASQTAMTYDTDEDNWFIFKSAISDAGYIVLDTIIPIVYINGIPIDNTAHRMIMQPTKTTLTNRTETTVETDKWGNTDISNRTYYFYKIEFVHQSIEPGQDIILYNAKGVETMTITANDGHMDYGRGVYYAPGDQVNSTLESLSTATYYVLYASNALEIDYDTVKFKIKNTILPAPTKAEVTATFEYFTIFTPAKGIGAIIDGRWDTQVQTEFFAQPPSGYNYAILDLGATKTIQAIDIMAGFYRPDDYRKFDIDCAFTLHYSTDGTNYYEISDETHNFRLTGGEARSFEEGELGIGFQARYLKVLLENVKKVDYRDGVYPVAITEIAIYDNVILKAEANLIATTTLSEDLTNLDLPIVYYKMNDNAADTSVLNTMSGPNGVSARNTSLMSAEGMLGTSLTFNGTTDKVDCGSDFLGTGAISISAWIYPTGWGEGSYGRIVDNGKVLVYIDNINDIVRLSSNGGFNAASSATNSIVLNKWTHIVAVRNSSGTGTMYVNGLISGAAGQAIGTAAGGTNVIIGNRANGTRTFDGRIDNVRMYDYALSASAIISLFNTGAGREDYQTEVINVVSTYGFTDPDSGETATAYIGNLSFTYTGLTSTSFIGCEVDSGVTGDSGDRLAQSLETDTTIYDDDSLLEQLGDRVYKEMRISEELLYTQTQLDDLAKDYLTEFYKEHNKRNVNIYFTPYLKVGQTVSLTDSYNNESAVKYFIESIGENNGLYNLILAKYPS